MTDLVVGDLFSIRRLSGERSWSDNTLFEVVEIDTTSNDLVFKSAGKDNSVKFATTLTDSAFYFTKVHPNSVSAMMLLSAEVRAMFMERLKSS